MKPTLQEIADMNHSDGVNAMREHYDPTWPMVTAEPVEGGVLKEYEVEVHYSYATFESTTVTVKAYSDDEAEEMAQTLAEKKIDVDGWDLEGLEIKDVREIDG